MTQIAIGSGMIALSVAIHAAFMGLAIRYGRGRANLPRGGLGKAAAAAGCVIWFFLSICAISWVWALLFRLLGSFASTEEALYFATVSFTTLGYGDVVLDPPWRLLGAFAAANGTLIFGWTTAMIFVVIQRIYAADLEEL